MLKALRYLKPFWLSVLAVIALTLIIRLIAVLTERRYMDE